MEKGTIEFKDFFKQISVPFEIYGDFGSNWKAADIYEGFCSKKYQDHLPCSFVYKVVCIEDRFTKPIVAFRDKNVAYYFFKAIIKEYEYCKKK